MITKNGLNLFTMTNKEASKYIGTMLDTFYKKDQFLLDNDVAERAITHRMGMYLQQILEP